MWPGNHLGQVSSSTEQQVISGCSDHQDNYSDHKGYHHMIRNAEECDFIGDRSLNHCRNTAYIQHNTENVHHRPTSFGYSTVLCPRRCFQRSHKRGLYTHIRIVATCFVLCLLSGYAVASKDFNFPDFKQGKFAQGLANFHISWPSRVNHLGEVISQDVHVTQETARSKRSISGEHRESSKAPTSIHSDTIYTTNKLPENELVHHFKIPIHEDKEVIVKVSQTDILLAPSAVVERKISKFNNVSDSIFSTLEKHHGCHFVGKVQDENNSKVALSACGGLRGFLRLENDEYLIEPIKGINKTETGGQPHLIYKRSALPDHLDFISRTHSEEPSCGVNEAYDRSIRLRERWEKHRQSTLMRSQQKTSKDTAHSRKKRSISIEKHVETLIVVDTEMVNYYENEDIENYVLTVMNMVATLFHDASIGNAVNIVIVRIILMQDPDENLRITHHADKTLKSFCHWQNTMNFKNDDHPNHHDVAVLMTRRNICSRNNEPCSTLGLAQVAGLCQPHRTCSINEDTGLSLAWTVAHELGHNFGMKHDNQQNDCTSDPDIQYVMAPHLTWDKTPSRWSNCSRTAITKFLDRNWGYCLDDPPGHHDFKYPELPAGTMYDAEHQCRILYGEGAERCEGIEDLEQICATLWCRVNNKCSTKLQPAAVGTICGHDKWCFAGQCVDIGERPQAIDGQWSQWVEWTSCTRTCGAGVSVSERHCNHPPPSSGGKFCTGERKRYRICNTNTCPDDGVSFRSQQCSEFNQIPYRGKMHEWKPLLTPETPCQLHCETKDLQFSVMMKDTVTDGTPCVIGSRHMCISGICRHVGCDWIIDSSATEDRCGICFGDGSTCETIKEQFNETKIQGYVEATVIPAGARNIRVEEVAEASNFLALKNNAGEYYLNGHWFIQWSGDYEVAGTVISYNRVGNKEKFSAPGPLKEPLHIMLLMQTHNPGVEFEYTVPKENVTNNRKLEFSWDYMDWSHCTVSCGGGTQRSAVICKEQEAGLVDEKYCDQSTKPDDQMRACNVHLCPARWWTGPWQHCSVTCDKGTHQRTVICIRSLGSDEQIALEDQACEGLKKPVEIEPCHHKDPCPQLGVWQVDEWSNCTKPCDGGSQYRNVSCTGGNICDYDKPKAVQSCNEQKCVDEVEKEILTIQEGGADASNDILQPDLSTPSSSSSDSVVGIGDDNLIPLGDDNLIPLNAANRNILLNDSTSDDAKVEASTDNNIQIGNINKLQPSHSNHDSELKDYNFTNMTSFLVEDKSENVSNSGELPNQDEEHTDISNITRDALAIELPEGGSPYEWQALPWSTCTSQCGQGVRTREVVCIQAKTRETVNNDLCELGNKPSAIDECFESICLEWQTGAWEECSATCGQGSHFRNVFCANPGHCDISEKPESSRPCEELKPCIIWVYGDWSQCTKSCGTGNQERLVQCVNLSSQQLSEGCESDVKPSEKQDCNEHDCPADDNAALTVSCESNEMSFHVCQMLKKVGMCHKEYVQAKCCRTCHHDVRPKPDVPNLS